MGSSTRSIVRHTQAMRCVMLVAGVAVIAGAACGQILGLRELAPAADGGAGQGEGGSGGGSSGGSGVGGAGGTQPSMGGAGGTGQGGIGGAGGMGQGGGAGGGTGGAAACFRGTGGAAPLLMPSRILSSWGSQGDDLPQALARDPKTGDLIVGVTLNGTAEIGGTSYTSVAQAGGGPSQDVLIVRLRPDGTVRWVRQVGGPATDLVLGVAIDGTGNVYAVGDFAGKVTVDTGSITSAGGRDGFLIKLDPNGGFAWAKRFGSTGDDGALSVAVTSSQTVVVAGVFTGSETFGGTKPLAASSFAGNAFLASYSSGGGFLFARAFPSSFSIGVDVAVTRDQQIVLGGGFRESVDFGDGVLVFPGSGTANSLFVARLNGADGTLTGGWAKLLGGTGHDTINEIELDEQDNVYLTGTFEDRAIFGGDELKSAGMADVYVAKLSPNGSHLWSFAAGGPADDYGNGLAVAGDDVYVAGSFGMRFDLQGTRLQSAGGFDGWVARLASCSGAARSVMRFGAADYDEAYDLVVDGEGRAVVGATFAGMLDLGGGLTRMSAGEDDALLFVAP